MAKKFNFETTFTYDGRRYHVRADSEKELYQKLANKKRDLEEGKVTVGPDMPVRKWAELALDTYKQNVSEDSLEATRLRLGKHVYSAIGSLPIRSIKPIHCQNIMNAQAGMSYGHVQKLSQELKFIFRTAVENKIILENPAEHIVLPSAEKGHRRALTDNEARHFLACCDQDPGFRVFELMYYCGCRPGEAVQAIGKDIEAKKGTPILHIRGTKSENADRYVPIPSPLYHKIKDTAPFDIIAPNRSGRMHSESSYKRCFSSLCRAMNISMGCKVYRNQLLPPFPLSDDLVPYCLRHTYCTNLAKSNVDIRTAQKLMGHASIQMTADIYTHVDQDQIISAASKIDAFYIAN